MSFGGVAPLDKIYISGYPVIPNSTNRPMVSYSGEVNSYIQGMDKCNYITFSSLIKKGNSGGPILNTIGQLTGMAIQERMFADSTEISDFSGDLKSTFSFGLSMHDIILSLVNLKYEVSAHTQQ